MNAIATIPRIFVERMHGSELLGYYASVATPAVIIQSFANVIFAPFITVFSRFYQEKKKKVFYNLFLKLLLFCLALGVVGYFGSMICGEFVLDKILYRGRGIAEYCYLLNSTIIVVDFVAVIWLLSIILTIDRANIWLSVSTCIGAVAECVLGYFLIGRYKLDGINYSMILSYSIIVIIMGIGIKRRLGNHFQNVASLSKP